MTWNIKNVFGDVNNLPENSLEEKIDPGYLDKQTNCRVDKLYLAKIEHPTEILDDVRHFGDFFSAFFKLSSYTIAFAYVSTYLQTME